MSIKPYRRFVPSTKLINPKSTRDRTHRGSARKRGYDREWELLAKEFLKSKSHVCEECLKRGFVTPAVLVDHIKPLRDFPELRLDTDNLYALCSKCHNGFKRRIENYARRNNAFDLLPLWIKDPDTRPGQFQIIKSGPVSGR